MEEMNELLKAILAELKAMNVRAEEATRHNQARVQDAERMIANLRAMMPNMPGVNNGH